MASKSTTNNKTLLNPIFSIPAGAEEEFVHTDDVVLTGAGGETDAVSQFTGDEALDDGTEGGEGNFEDTEYVEQQLSTPTDFHVFAQTLRRAPGGQQIVDVTIESEDISGAENYEFQVVKI